LDITYCLEKCLTGNAASKNFLNSQNSIFDAVVDFQLFTTKCFETCPYKEAHVNIKDKEF
jgi:hypothetical protein